MNPTTGRRREAGRPGDTLLLVYDAGCGGCSRLVERLGRLGVVFTARHCRDPELASLGLPTREVARLRACRAPAVITGTRVRRGVGTFVAFGRRVPTRHLPRALLLAVETALRRLLPPPLPRDLGDISTQHAQNTNDFS